MLIYYVIPHAYVMKYTLWFIPDQKYNVFKDKITIGLEMKSRGCEI